MALFLGVGVVEAIVIGLLVRTLAGATHRLFFHPLSHIPGPRLAALTWWYEFYYDGIKQGRYVFKIQELHKQYGASHQEVCWTILLIIFTTGASNS